MAHYKDFCCVVQLAALLASLFPYPAAALDHPFPAEAISHAAASQEYASVISDLRATLGASSDASDLPTATPASARHHGPSLGHWHPADRNEEPLYPPPTTTRAMPISQYGDTFCSQEDIVLPTSTEEVAAAVRYYYSLVPPYQPHNWLWADVKVRVASRIRGINMPDSDRDVLGFTERPGFSCPTGTSPVGTRSAVIATTSMRRVLRRDGRFVTVQAGMTQTELIHFANSKQLTVPLGTLAAYNDLTVGGMLATGAHAQGPSGSSNLADIVTDITFVDGTGRAHTVPRDCLEGRGLAGGLGMLGIITEVTLELQPGLSKTKVFAIGPKSDDNIEQEMEDLIAAYQSRLFIWWRPDQRLVKYIVFEEQTASTPSNPPEDPASGVVTVGGAVKPFSDDFIKQFTQGLLAVTFDLPNATFADGVCRQTAQYLVDQKWAISSTNQLTDNATALTNNLQGIDCNIPGNPSAGSCFFDFRVFDRLNAAEIASGSQPTPSLTAEEAEFALPMRHLRNFLSDFKSFSRNGLQGACWPPSIIFIRPASSTQDLISPQSGAPSERFVWFELGMFRPNLPARPTVFRPRLQKKLSAVQEFWEQLLVCKYGARPHWGKAWDRVFTSAACPVRDLYPNFNKQLKLQRAFDPAKLFETSMMSTLIGGGKTKHYPACTNEMACYCETDEDCGLQGVLHCRMAPPPLPPYRLCLP